MVVELVTFKAPEGADWQSILGDPKATLPHWRANTDLVRKHYLVGGDGGTCAGLYIWPSRAAAERGHDATWRAGVEKRTGARPTITYFDLMMVLDNETGTVTEWSESGDKRSHA
jgi:hypothetical protein